jgi:hypothetical protein
MTEEKEKGHENTTPVVKYSQLYRFASGKDKLLMAVGTLFALIMG